MVCVSLFFGDLVELTQGSISLFLKEIASVDHSNKDDSGSEPPSCSLNGEDCSNDTCNSQVSLILRFHDADAYADKALNDESER